ncbi:MAG: cobalamin biosynthesis protein CbiD [Synergistaceae bacterium]|nr:cobalamin biosynthesis protein CbiD [Synergistaceae bacterium]
MCNHQCNSLQSLKSLKYGISTGACAAGASKAAAIFLSYGKCPDSVTIKNLEGHEFLLHTFKHNANYFGVIKDSGDDKGDITNGVKVLARLEVLEGNGKILFSAGEGVGTVTLPGLKIRPGEPAINPVPRKMIELAVREVIPHKSLRVTIAIPDGEKLALRTFNPRLGITGGLSVLGTSGFVKPINEQALLDSLSLELNMIHSLGFRELYITFGHSGELAVRKIFNVTGRNIIQAGNYIGYVLDEATGLEFSRVIICGHPGKLLKVAAGNFNTHNKISDGRLEALCTHLALSGASREVIEKVFHCNTTNEAMNIIAHEKFNHVWNNLAEIVTLKSAQRVYNKIHVDAAFIDDNGNVLGVNQCLR